MVIRLWCPQLLLESRSPKYHVYYPEYENLFLGCSDSALNGAFYVTVLLLTLLCFAVGEEASTVYSFASKYVSIMSLPPVLTLHLKRFRQTENGVSVKVHRHVAFPLLLDMKPYCGDSDMVSDYGGSTNAVHERGYV